MKSLFIISSFIFIVIKINAQDSCLPKYGLPIEIIKLSYGNMAYAEKGNGETILFVHGLGGNISHWIKTINGLSASYHCIAIDLPGYGWSDEKPAANTDQLQLYADALKEFLEKRKIKKVIVAGHSMGGQVATIMALQNKKVKKLILVAPAGLETFSESEAKMLIASTPASAFEKQDETVIRNNFKINFYNQPADVEQLIQDRLAFKKCEGFKSYCETVSNGVKGMLAHPVRDSLKYLSMPVLILFGANDALIPNKYLHPAMQTRELARQSAALIKNCRVEMIAEAGHMVQYEKPEELNSIVKTFVK
jgi:pimeloyl-ACP methyl ester carboxylesterase